MHWGFGVAHLSSETFWMLTPREVAAALTSSRGAHTLSRSTFDMLMQNYPDHPAERGSHDTK